MNVQPLNLLHYPRRGPLLASGQLRSSLVTVVAGALVGGLWSGWQHMRLAQLDGQHAQLQARLQAKSRQQADASVLHEQDRLRRQLSERARDWQDRRQQWMRLHQALDKLADDPGLRVQRWQGDGQRITLEAWLPGPDAVSPLLARLSAASPQSWRLKSLGEQTEVKTDAPGVAAVLEASGPVPGQGGGAARP